MSGFQPSQLSDVTGGEWYAGEPPEIRAFCFDTRRIESGDCFVALKSELRDGHDFVSDAASKGASCALTERALNLDLPQLVVEDSLSAMGAIAGDRRAGFSKPVVGITGSCGKTSTKEMLRRLLGEASTHATSGNWNNRIGVPMTLFDLDPLRHEFAVIEAGINQPGEMAMLGAMIQADLTILTNIGPAHLELLGSLEGIAEEKAKLAESARENSPIVLPAAALHYPAFAAMAERCIAVSFEGETAPEQAREVVDCRVESVAGEGRMRFMLLGQSYELRSPSQGIARNAALAVVAATFLGLKPEALAERLLRWQPEETRGRVLTQGGRFDYIDCYNANPASMRDALQAFQVTAPDQLPRCYVIGAMNELGELAEELHFSIGEKISLRAQDSLICVGPGNLSDAYRAGALNSGALPTQIQCAENVSGIQSSVADFKGAVFLKGSRAYRLEQLVPGPATQS